MSTVMPGRTSGSQGLARLALIVVGALALYFIYEQAIRYFVWSEESYGYFWQFRIPVIIHITGGTLALTMGVFQLWTGLNNKVMGTHPLTGKVYVGGVLIGSAGGYWLAITSHVYGPAWGVALFFLATAWLTTTLTALACIRRRNIRAHQQWMVRSYIVTFGFVLFRIAIDHVPYDALWGISRAEMANASIWTSWAVPLLAYQIYLQMREL